MSFSPRKRQRFTPAQPVIVSVSPSSGTYDGGVALTLRLSAGVVTSVQIGAYACTSVAQSGRVVTCVTPATATATYDVIATGPGGIAALYAAYAATNVDGILSEADEPLVTEAGESLVQEAA